MTLSFPIARTPELSSESGLLLIDGAWVSGKEAFTVRNKATGAPLCEVAHAERDQVDAAVAAARRSFAREPLDPYARYEVLTRAAALLHERRAHLIATIVAETGFTVSDSAGEVDRCIQTFLLSGEEAKRISGEMVPLSGAPGQAHRIGFTIRVPRGVVAAITPFNSPLNTVAHKVAPALAAGNTVVLKPSSMTPLTAALLCQMLLDAGLPPSHINLVHGSGAEVGDSLTRNEDVAFYTFTGSTATGREIQRSIGLRRSSLELGSIACTIVCDDADLERAVQRCVNAGYRKAGQVCTSVQRLYVQRSIAARFTEMLAERVKLSKAGDPYDYGTLVGPMIAEREARRAESWVNEAVASGARLAAGGGRDGALMEPVLLTGASRTMRVMSQEIFAPVISLVHFDSFDEALAEVDSTEYGLATGIFTRDIDRALHACRRLQVGAVHINETSSSRVDLMPYGGVKASGFGREGPRYAIEEMTEERLITISLSNSGAIQ
ncbi:MAG TPA: aldehyde dehydrogenase family protein [Gemmatimonadaceae bacterium]